MPARCSEWVRYTWGYVTRPIAPAPQMRAKPIYLSYQHVPTSSQPHEHSPTSPLLGDDNSPGCSSSPCTCLLRTIVLFCSSFRIRCCHEASPIAHQLQLDANLKSVASSSRACERAPPASVSTGFNPNSGAHDRRIASPRSLLLRPSQRIKNTRSSQRCRQKLERNGATLRAQRAVDTQDAEDAGARAAAGDHQEVRRSGI